MTAKRSTSNDSQLCQFPFADGRRCRMLLHKGHPTLCVFHARMERQLLDAEKLGGEISKSISGNFYTAADVSHVLGKLFAAIAQNRLPPRNAAMLSYVGQLLLHSVPLVRHEIISSFGAQRWRQLVYDTLHDPSSDSDSEPDSSSASEPNSDSGSKSDPPRPA
jgi:hypothetical protein